jgi:hypothetical protein
MEGLGMAFYKANWANDWKPIFGLGLALSLLPFFTTPSGWALELKDVPGKWKSNTNVAYEVTLLGPTITVQRSPVRPGNCDTYRGTLHLSAEFALTCVPKSIDELGDNLPLLIRQQLMARGYQYRATGQLRQDNTIDLTFISDTVTYNSAGTRISSINLDDEMNSYLLSKRLGFKVGEISQDDTLFRRRAAAESAELQRRIDRIEKDQLPGLQLELESMKQLEAQQKERIAHYERERDVDTAQMGAIEARMAEIRSSILSEMVRLSTKQPNLTAERTRLLEEVQALRNRVASLPESQQEARQNAYQQYIQANQQLDAIESRLREELGSIIPQAELDRRKDEIESLAQRAKRVGEDRKIVNDHLITLRNQLDAIQKRMTAKTEEIYAKNQQIGKLQNTMEALKATPAVTGLTVVVGGTPRFYASIDQDKQVLDAMIAQHNDIVAELYAMPARVDALKQVKTEAASRKNSAKYAMTDAAYDTILAEQDVAALIWENAKYRAAASTAVYFYDVISAGLEGGPAGIFADLTGKLVEHYALNDAQFFKSFDETELRQTYQGLQIPEPGTIDTVLGNPVFGQAASSTVEFMESAFENEFETIGKVWEKQAAKNHLQYSALNYLSEEAGLANAAVQRVRDAQANYLRALRNPSASIQETMSAITVRRQALSNLANVHYAPRMAAAPLQRANAHLKKVGEELKELRKVDLKKAAAGVGRGILLDQLKNLCTAHFDAQEQQAWTKFFEKEIYYKVQYQHYKVAAMNYWLATDRLLAANQYWQTLWALSKEMETEISEYGHRRRDGFYIGQNTEFNDDQGPVEMTLEVVGPSIGEDSFFLRTPGIPDPAVRGLAHGPLESPKGGGPAVPTPDANQLENGERNIEKAIQATAQSTYRYSFDPASLKRLKAGGELPVKVQHK